MPGDDFSALFQTLAGRRAGQRAGRGEHRKPSLTALSSFDDPRTTPGTAPPTCRHAPDPTGVDQNTGPGECSGARSRSPTRYTCYSVRRSCAPANGRVRDASAPSVPARSCCGCSPTAAPSRARASHPAPRPGARHRVRSCRHPRAGGTGRRRKAMATRRARRRGDTARGFRVRRPRARCRRARRRRARPCRAVICRGT
jgi:hypothetical protein